MPAWLHDLIGQLLSATLSTVGISAFVTVLIAGFVRGFVGFGSSLMIVMVLSLFVGPPAAVAIAGLSGLAPVLQLLPNAIRFSERAFVLPFASMTFIAAPIGTWVLVVADPAIMRIVISLFVLIMVVMLYRNWKPRGAENVGFLVSAGFVSGAVQGASGVGGPPAVAIALARSGSPQIQRANVIGTTSALTLCGLPPLWYNGVFTQSVVVIAVASVPFYMLGTWLGARAFSTYGNRHFRNAALLSLAVVGVVTLALAVRDYAGPAL
ncbi:MAG: sulfite exporter TauE/SafE family protein [Hyphomicrobiaceae bacterium]